MPCLRAPMQCFGVTDVVPHSAVQLTRGPTVSRQSFLQTGGYLTRVTAGPRSELSNDGTVGHSLVK